MRGNTQNNIKNFSWTEERFEVWDPRDPWLPYKANEKKLYSLCFYFKIKDIKLCMKKQNVKRLSTKKYIISILKFFSQHGMIEDHEAMSMEFWWKMAVKQESNSEIRGKKEKDIIKHEKSQKLLQPNVFSGKKFCECNNLK